MARNAAAKRKTPPASGLSRFMVPDGRGGWQEASGRDLFLIEIDLLFAANGYDTPPSERARAAAAYDKAAAEMDALAVVPLLDKAA